MKNNMNTFKINTLLIVFSLLSFFAAHSAVAAADIPATVTYSCKWGGTPSGSNCNVAATSYPASYTFSGDAIGGISAANSGVDVLTAWPSGVNVVGTSGAGCEAFSKGWSGPYYFHGGITVAQIKSGRQTYSICGDFTCPILTTLSGQTCTEAAYTYAASPSYSCPTGTTITGTMCTSNTTGIGKCGSANDTPQRIGVTLSEFQAQTNLCASGSYLSMGGIVQAVSGNSFYWCCSDRTGAKSCSDSGHGVPCATPGICGTANSTVATTRPANTSACTVGDIWNGPTYNTFIMDNKGPWTWQCGTMAQAQLANCSTIAAPIGICEPTLDKQVLAGPPRATYLCSAGTESVLNGDGSTASPWSWTCTGSNAVATACSAKKTCAPSCANPSTVCSGSPIGNDGCGGTCPGFGTKTDGVCVPVDNSCAANTCTGTQCANNKGTMIDGTKNCSVGTTGWKEVAP
jgi:conjugal transfer mating pair stabilization protein TraN